MGTDGKRAIGDSSLGVAREEGVSGRVVRFPSVGWWRSLALDAFGEAFSVRVCSSMLLGDTWSR